METRELMQAVQVKDKKLFIKFKHKTIVFDEGDTYFIKQELDEHYENE
jgi:hypothetical protein